MTVTDVGSTKGGVCAAKPPASAASSVGTRSAAPRRVGLKWATAGLFEGATWFLTPVAATDPDSYKVLHGFVSSLGAVPVAIDPEAHDRLVAVTSHLPHALANVLLNQAGGGKVDGRPARCGRRLAARHDPRRRREPENLGRHLPRESGGARRLAEHRRRVEQVESALAAGDAGFLARWIGEASANRRRLLETAYADAGALQRLRVHVPDKPGVIAEHRPGAGRRADQHRRLRPRALQ